MLPIKVNLALPSGWETTIYAEEQRQYQTLPVVRSLGADRRVISRWTLTDAERERIGGGEDAFLTLLTYGEPLQPVLLCVGAPVLMNVEPAPSPRDEMLDNLKAATERVGAAAGSEDLDVVGGAQGKASLPTKM